MKKIFYQMISRGFVANRSDSTCAITYNIRMNIHRKILWRCTPAA